MILRLVGPEADEQMTNISVLNRRGDDEDDDLMLGTPDAAEAASLDRHVERCAMRYRLFTRRLKSHGDAVKRIEYILYGVAVWLGATSPIAQDMLKRLLGH